MELYVWLFVIEAWWWSHAFFASPELQDLEKTNKTKHKFVKENLEMRSEINY